MWYRLDNGVSFLYRYGGGSRFGDRDRGGSRFGGGGRGGFGGSGFGGGGFGRSMKGSQPGDRLRKPRWDMEKLPKFEKNFYQEHPAVQSRPEHEIQSYREAKSITVKGRGVPKPVFHFTEASFPGEHTVLLRKIWDVFLNIFMIIT